MARQQRSERMRESVGWFIGWDLLLEYTAIVAVVAVGVSQYAAFLLDAIGLHLPTWAAGAPGSGDGHYVNLLAIVLCLGVAWLLNRGMQTSARVETYLVFVKGSNLHPYFPFGFSDVTTGAATVFFAVLGYDAMSTAAEESKDAERNLPKAIILSLSIAMVLYLLACTVLTGMIKYKDISVSAAYSEAFARLVRHRPRRTVAGLVAKTNAQRSPYRPVWIVGVFSAILSGLLPIDLLAQLTNIGILLAFIVVSAAVIVLHYRSPELPRTFRVPFMPVTPILGIGFSIWLVSKLPLDTWLRFIACFVLGVIVYAFYGYRNSRLGRGEAVEADPESELK